MSTKGFSQLRWAWILKVEEIRDSKWVRTILTFVKKQEGLSGGIMIGTVSKDGRACAE